MTSVKMPHKIWWNLQAIGKTSSQLLVNSPGSWNVTTLTSQQVQVAAVMS